VITKLDGTAKGGAVLPIWRELGVPILWVGVGEGMEDLVEFRARDFARALVRR
jgi:fused signal recognition particle receptor